MRRKALLVCLFMLAVGVWAPGPSAVAVPNPVATTDAQYLAYGRVFPDPQGCGVNPPGFDPTAISPWAKGNVCVTQFLGYDEVLAGAGFLERRHPRFLRVIRLDQAYDDPSYRSAGIPTQFGLDDDGEPELLTRDRRPLYLFKVTDGQSPIPERERKHFVYALSIHGIERAGLEGGIRAMEDLITWAACEASTTAAPACDQSGVSFEGPFPRPIVETPTTKAVPTAGEVLRKSVIYFMTPNPDGWHRGEIAEGGVFFQRYNGNGVDLNRDWPTLGYTYRPYSPGSEPETQAYTEVLRGIRQTTAAGRFAGGIDLHGQLTANAFSYTLLGAGQRDFRKNFSTVDQSLRAWEDQTARLAWSPYVTNGPNDPGPDHVGVFPAADQWGTVIDTIGYQVSGALGDWIESDAVGLGGVGIDNEMSLSHLVPNTVYDPINEQMHVDGNKGLIYSQIASMLTEEDADYAYDPPGKVGYVLNPSRVSAPTGQRPQNPGLPAQKDIDTPVPCPLGCDGGTFALQGTQPTLEFDVLGPSRGFFNGGITVTATFANLQGISPGSVGRLVLERFDEEGVGSWQPAATSFVQAQSGIVPDLYLQAGQIVTVNDPVPGRWRVRLTSDVGLPARLKIDFNPVTAEEDPGQAAFSSSSMDFFYDLNAYIDDPADRFEAVTVRRVIDDPASLQGFDSLVVVNTLGRREAVQTSFGLTDAEGDAYFANLRSYADGGGNLVLTDAALNALPSMGLVPAGSITSNQPLWGGGRGPAPRYQLNVGGRGNLCMPDTTDPLARAVCLSGTAGGTLRQAVEPTPLGYAPDATLDGAAEARLREWLVNRAAWQAGCGKANGNECTSALLNGQTGLGERHLGAGVVRVAGAMLPDPLFLPGATRDMRFGTASYALTFSAWQIFLNLVDYQRTT
ncbi:MAG: M14 family zinc carboxypeptidase [Actinomycetota bacterium]